MIDPFQNLTTLHAEKGKAPTRFLLMQAGHVGWAGPQDFILDAATAERIIAAFEEHGAKIPIDYHHATEKVRPELGGKAPAAGFITKLEWVPGEGLFAADVQWNEQGRKDVEDGSFAFTSPAILHDTDLNIFALSSVALTNKPRTIECRELLTQLAELGGIEMPKKIADTKTKVKALAQDEIEPAIGPDGKAIADLIEVLRAAGSEVDDSASLVEVLLAAIEQIRSGMTEEPTVEPEEPEAEAEAKAEADADTGDPIVTPSADANVDAVRNDVLTSQVPELQKRVKALEEQLSVAEAEKKAKRVEALVQGVIDDNKLLPNNDKALASARALAAKDEKGFLTLFASIEPYAKVGSQTAGTDTDAPDARGRVIKKACAEYDNDPKVAVGCQKRFWVDSNLDGEGFAELSDAEVATLEGGK